MDDDWIIGVDSIVADSVDCRSIEGMPLVELTASWEEIVVTITGDIVDESVAIVELTIVASVNSILPGAYVDIICVTPTDVISTLELLYTDVSNTFDATVTFSNPNDMLFNTVDMAGTAELWCVVKSLKFAEKLELTISEMFGVLEYDKVILSGNKGVEADILGDVVLYTGMSLIFADDDINISEISEDDIADKVNETSWEYEVPFTITVSWGILDKTECISVCVKVGENVSNEAVSYKLWLLLLSSDCNCEGNINVLVLLMTSSELVGDGCIP